MRFSDGYSVNTRSGGSGIRKGRHCAVFVSYAMNVWYSVDLHKDVRSTRSSVPKLGFRVLGNNHSGRYVHLLQLKLDRAYLLGLQLFEVLNDSCWQLKDNFNAL